MHESVELSGKKRILKFIKMYFEIKVITLWICLLSLIKLITICEEALSYLYIHAHTDVFKQGMDVTIKQIWTKY